MSTERMNYVGWFRPARSPAWQKVTVRPTHAAALDALLDVTSRQSGDLVVLPAGERPDVRRRRIPVRAAR